MYSLHTDEELILGVDEKDFDQLKDFLYALNLRGEAAEILDHFDDEDLGEDAHAVETDDGEEFIIVFGKKKIHVILKKNGKYEEIKEKLFSYVN